MIVEEITIPWGWDDRLRLEIPSSWRVISQSQVSTPDPIRDLSSAIKASLNEPIGSPPCKDLSGMIHA